MSDGLAGRFFRRLWASQFATVTMVYGLSLAGVAFLEEQTGSSAGTGLVILSSILPAFLGSLVAGAVVDRFGRRPTLLVAHFARALLAVGFWAVTRFLPAGAALAGIVAVNLFTAAFGQFAFPAELSLVPDLVSAEIVPRANAILQFGMLLGEGLGVIFLTPLLIRLFGVPAVGLSGAVLCLAALLLVLGLPADGRLRPPPTPSRHRPPFPTPDRRDGAGQVPMRGGGLDKSRSPGACGLDKSRSPGASGLDKSRSPGAREESGRPRLRWEDLKEGWKTIAADPLLRLVVLQATVGATLLLVLLSLLPGLATRHLGIAVADAPFLILPGGLAFVVTAILVSRRQAWLSPPAWIAAGLLVLGAGTVLLGFSAAGSGGIAVALPFALLRTLPGITAIGLGLGAVVIPARVVLQQRPPPDLRARVIAGQLTLANAAAVIPLLVGGSLADRLGLGEVMMGLGVVALLAGLAGAGYLRRGRLDSPR
ncbi:MAG: MFS transporter [Anaerolineaceae bacterium]|nr:MFS transporter [Anaerolineaceae bacterium]